MALIKKNLIPRQEDAPSWMVDLEESLYRKHRLVETFMNSLLIFLIGLMIFVLLTAVMVGCGSPHVPWNKGTSWNIGKKQEKVTHEEKVPQKPIENFCEDNRADINSWRRYLDESYDWPGVAEERVETRERNLRRLIEQFDERCSP